MSTYGTRSSGGSTVITNKATGESMVPYFPVTFRDDFLGKAIDTTNNWTALDTSAAGLTTPVLVANAPSGIVSLPLDNTNEAQLTGLYTGDTLNWVLNQGLSIEYVAKLITLPTGAVIFAAGMASAHNATLDSVATSAWFRADGSGAITVECDDGTNETSKVATNVTLLANVMHTFRIDFINPANVLFFIDGAPVASTTTFDMSTVPTAALQPYIRLSKGAATTVGEIGLDVVRIMQNRS